MDGLTRKLMPPMLLVMWGGLYWLWSNNLLAGQLAVGLGVSHLICTIIFYHFVYVFNYGYAWTMIVMPILYAVPHPPPLAGIALLIVIVAYGIRLLNFAWSRYHSESYSERAANARAASQTIPLPIKIITWCFTGSLMFYLGFGAWVIASGTKTNNALWIAVIVMVFGLLLEAIADRQKQRAKQVNKDVPCYTGLYRKIRHPNYLGEIIFHIGFYLGIVASTDEAYPLVLGAFGTGWLLMLMCDEAVISDRKQTEKYGDTEEFVNYQKRSGMLLPRLF